MITNKQLRAARVLVDISQEKVAENVSVTKRSVQNIEKEGANTNTSTGAALQQFYESCGIEFLEHDGVRMNPNDPVYEGAEGFRKFFDDVYQTARDQGGNISLFNGVPGLLVKWLGEDWYAMHAQRMAAIADNFDFRVIIEESDTQLIGASFARYKWFPADQFEKLTIYIYGDKAAFLHFEEDSVTVEVKRDLKTVRVLRILFNIAWEHVAQEVTE